jgi:PilZ domain
LSQTDTSLKTSWGVLDWRLAEPMLSEREHPRLELEVDGAMPARIPALDVTLRVQNVSLGGVRTISPVPLNPGNRHRCEFPRRDADTLQLDACVTYCLPLEEDGGFAIGWAWTEDAKTADVARVLFDYLAKWAVSRSPAA